MARNLMPKSGIMMPYVVVSRDAAVVGVSTVDGKAGAIDLTTTYRKITDSYAKTETYTKTEVDNIIAPIMAGALFKADPFVNNNVPFRSGGANGVTSINLIKANTDNSIHVGDSASGVQGVHIYSEGRVDMIYKNDAGVETIAPLYSKRYRPEVADMPFAAVGDYVLDSQGRTVAVNRTGINSDLKTLNALTNINTTKVIFEKSPTIPDGALPYDAVNLRQLQSAGGGGGASMNGVMNNFIGSVQWFNGSRAKIPAGYIAADGQEESQTDPKTADLYAAVNADLFVTVTEALWQNSGNADTFRAGENRGAYVKQSSTGRFRVPDLNGASADGKSPRANFLRGDGGGTVSAEIGNVGSIKYNAAPNIVGSSILSILLGGGSPGTFGNGAFAPTTTVVGSGRATTTGDTPITYVNPMNFNASLSNPAYGRGSEVRPNSVAGIWIIRASGTFTAQSTNFNVITGDATQPANGTTVAPGLLRSSYQVAGADKYTASLTGTYKIGDSVAYALVQAALTGGAYTNFYFGTDGEFSVGDVYKVNMKTGTANLSSVVCVNGGAIQVDPINATIKNYVNLRNATGNPSSGAFVGWVQGGWYSDSWIAGGCRSGDTRLQSYKIQVSNPNATGYWEFLHDASGRIGTVAGYLTPVASDIRLKENVSEIESGALDRIKQIKPRDFEWKSDGRKDRGFVAQELAEVDARYVFEGGGEDPDKPLLNVSQPAIISDLVATVQSLIGQVENLKAEVAALKSNTK